MDLPLRVRNHHFVEFVTRYANREAARATHGELADTYARFYLRGDPLADAAAADLRAMADGHAVLGRAVAAHDAEGPESLRRLVAEARSVPEWVDFDRADEGARAYRRLGTAGFMVLSAWSLMNGYHSGPAVKPLMFTGQLNRSAGRRLAETARFVTEVAQRGAMRRGGSAVALAIQVRVMHAMVRNMLRDSADWDTAAWGVPINQADMAGTVVEFSLLVQRGAEQLGFVFSDREAEAMLHLWRYAGHVLGVHPRLLAELASVERGVPFAQLIHDVQPGPDEDSLALARALRATLLEGAERPWERAGARFVQRYHDGLTWAFNGDEIARDLGIPNRAWRHAVIPTRWVVGALEMARVRLPGATHVADWLGNRTVRRNVAGMLGGREPDFRARRV